MTTPAQNRPDESCRCTDRLLCRGHAVLLEDLGLLTPLTPSLSLDLLEDLAWRHVTAQQQSAQNRPDESL